MQTIIGLGSAGCNIAEQFKKYPQYTVYKIDTDVEGENCIQIKEQTSPENYERNVPDLSNYFNNISGELLFIVAGGGNISGASLQILKYAKKSKINILYIRPAKSDLSQQSYLQDRLIRNVFQQYARSGVFEMLYMVSNEELEEIIGDIPILEHNIKINEYLVSLIHWINVFKNSDPIIDNYSLPNQTARIATFGVLDINNSEENLLYPLDSISDKCYYFAINETSLKTDGKLLKNIREQVANSGLMASYEIHSIKYPNSFCYSISYTNITQPLDK